MEKALIDAFPLLQLRLDYSEDRKTYRLFVQAFQTVDGCRALYTEEEWAEFMKHAPVDPNEQKKYIQQETIRREEPKVKEWMRKNNYYFT